MATWLYLPFIVFLSPPTFCEACDQSKPGSLLDHSLLWEDKRPWERGWHDGWEENIWNIYRYCKAWLFTICRLRLVTFFLLMYAKHQARQPPLQHEQYETSSTAQLNCNSIHGASKSHRQVSVKEAGTSTNAGFHYQKLYARVTHIWGNRSHRQTAKRSAEHGKMGERTEHPTQKSLSAQNTNKT